MPELLVAAFPASVNDVLLVTDWTTPIEAPSVARRIVSPTWTWVRNDVPEPVTVAELLAVEIVPTFPAVHVEGAFQLPFVRAVRVGVAAVVAAVLTMALLQLLRAALSP